MNQNNTVVQD